jgi:hypothetical protein
MTPYAEYLLGRPKKPVLTPKQAARPERRYQAQPSSYQGGLSKQVGAACDRFFRRRGLK